ncbi:MAG: serine hydrolase domain-containing protein [Candidatus Thorarchaeota archaeon]|jgi:CubicO group peptidase (beta-lactamase class C family)
MNKAPLYLLIFAILMGPVLTAPAYLPTSSASSFAGVPSAQNDTPWPTDGWSISTPEEQGMDSGLLNQMLDQIIQQEVRIDSILIIRNGYLVFEEYPRPLLYDNEDQHIIHSCTKSYTSALVGIALKDGYIESIDSRLVDLLLNRTIANLDERKQAITLEHLLTMTSGLEWDEWTEPYNSPQNSLNQVWEASDSVQHILDLPMAYEPGEVWVYSSGGSHLLGAIVAEATGTSLFSYGIENLFTPLGISASNIMWPRDRQGRYWGHGGVSMVPRDMAKFGYLYLNNGTWDGEQILPTEWVQQSAATLYEFNDYSGYSYQWWTNPTDIANVYSAQGFSGQFIFVIPSLDMVVVFTSNVPPYEPYPQSAILFDYIIKAAMNEIPQGLAAADALTLTTLVVLPLPLLIAGVYFRIRTKKWFWNPTHIQEVPSK